MSEEKNFVNRDAAAAAGRRSGEVRRQHSQERSQERRATVAIIREALSADDAAIRLAAAFAILLKDWGA